MRNTGFRSELDRKWRVTTCGFAQMTVSRYCYSYGMYHAAVPDDRAPSRQRHPPVVGRLTVVRPKYIVWVIFCRHCLQVLYGLGS
jgi:hypothetical protein